MDKLRLDLFGLLIQKKNGVFDLDVPLVVDDPYGNLENITIMSLTLGGVLAKEYDESISYDYFSDDIISIFINIIKGGKDG